MRFYLSSEYLNISRHFKHVTADKVGHGNHEKSLGFHDICTLLQRNHLTNTVLNEVKISKWSQLENKMINQTDQRIRLRPYIINAYTVPNKSVK